MAMDTGFYIVLSIKTPDGYETRGQFQIGTQKEFAYDLFSKLKGSANIEARNILQLELMEMTNGLPLNVQMIGCTLDELVENSRIIVKETFRLLNMEES